MSAAMKLTERYHRLLDFLPLQEPGRCRQELEGWSSCHGITYRQVLRDLNFLAENGYVVALSKGNSKTWMRTPSRPSWHSMTREQAFLLHLVEKKMRHLMPDNMLQTLQPQWDFASEKLNLPECRNERSWFHKVYVLPPLLKAPKVLNGIFAPVITALLNETWLRVDYENQRREEHSANVMPLGLAEREQIYYLVVRFKDYSDVRHIRLDRISRAEELDEPFKYPVDFDLSSYIDSGVFDYVTGHTIQLELLMEPATANHLLDSPLSQDQALERQPDGRMRVCATVQDSERLFWWVLGFGRSVEVIKPDINPALK